MKSPEQEAQPTAEELLKTVYTELRRLASRRLAREQPGQTLQATALVHEAWLRLSADNRDAWDSPQEFYRAAANAMRCILIDNARRKQTPKHGGHLQRVDLSDVSPAGRMPADELLAVDEGLDGLAEVDAAAAELVKLRFFVGLTNVEAAEVLGISRSAADRAWVFARAWLFENIEIGNS